MILHFTGTYNQTYFTKAPGEINCSVRGTLEINDDDIYLSPFKTSKDFLKEFISWEDMLENIDNLQFDPADLIMLEDMFKHNQVNENG